MEDREVFLGRIVDIGAELFAMASVCVRATAESADRPEGMELADLFCRQAKVRADALFNALWDNTDAVDVKAAKRILDGRYAWLEEGVMHPKGDQPWVANWKPGPSTAEDVRRRIPPMS
jgi:hypothetical protein